MVGRGGIRNQGKCVTTYCHHSFLSANGEDGNGLQTNFFKFFLLVSFGEIAKNRLKFIFPLRNYLIFSSQYSKSDFTLKRRFFVKYLSSFGQRAAKSP